ncbi:MAG: hypothetical protein A2289_06245 [Deltaproteobacteria bacterium RIFOXYA12_FULL_58_15]|nr:MAG: hypothetical protein A2289_06245 [Deltaproteobacteria bacterium RIFOXYA12_FULL_58_15]OGR09866.1 MAG: hypothetical protein A2341_14270 [Deltaproteobacteria bacterium RIFOXYB12_FULL_58_9]
MDRIAITICLLALVSCGDAIDCRVEDQSYRFADCEELTGAIESANTQVSRNALIDCHNRECSD